MTRSRYVKAPVPSETVRPLYEATLRVLSGQTTVTLAAEDVGLSRLRFQTLVHRGLTGLMEALEPQQRGRPAMPPTERALREKVAALEYENAQLEKRLKATMRMMGLASEWMEKGLRGSRTRRVARIAKPTEPPMSDDEDGPASRLRAVTHLRAAGVCARRACSAIGVAPSTARRWAQRCARGAALRERRGPRRGQPVNTKRIDEAIDLAVATRGHVGAATLARVSGLSRRQAGEVKANVVTELEQQRRREAVRVHVVCGVVRAFDALEVRGQPVLVAADGGVPYRTSAEAVSRYDGDNVSRVLAADFEKHGAPLVLRADRWKAHEVRAVRDVLAAHGVLMLHGPPHCPRFYGQLERQNREHGAWLRDTELKLAEACEAMLTLFNELIPRRSLAWRTPGEAWRSRRSVTVDRAELAEEVAGRVRKLQEKASRVAYPWKLERQAIEAALINRGLLKLTKGGWC